MSFVFELDTQAAQANGGNGKLKSGVHDVEIKGIFLGADSKGNNTIDIVVETDKGQKAVIFGMCIDKTWKTGSANVNFARWNELAMIAGIKEGKLAPQARKMSGKDIQADAFVEATGKKVKMAIQEHYDVYDNEIKDKYQLVQTFGPEGHTVSEKLESKPAKKFVDFEVNPWYTPAYKVAEESGTLKKASGSTTATTTETPQEEQSQAKTKNAPLF
jgi:hypothetical protein